MRLHPNARSRNGLLSSIASALARPRQTKYVCPSLMTASAIIPELGALREWLAQEWAVPAPSVPR